MIEFISRDGEEKRVATTLGHCILVGTKPVGIPEGCENEAYQAGCIPADAVKAAKTPPPPDVPQDSKVRLEAIVNAMNEMLDAPETEKMMTAANVPNKTKLQDALGWKPTAEEFEACWETVQGNL